MKSFLKSYHYDSWLMGRWWSFHDNYLGLWLQQHARNEAELSYTNHITQHLHNNQQKSVEIKRFLPLVWKWHIKMLPLSYPGMWNFIWKNSPYALNFSFSVIYMQIIAAQSLHFDQDHENLRSRNSLLHHKLSETKSWESVTIRNMRKVFW